MPEGLWRLTLLKVFSRDNIDVAIRFGQTAYPGLYAHPLAEEWVVPVMTPALAARYPTVQCLKDTPFIFDDSIKFIEPPVDWTVWFTAMGEVYTPVHGPRFFAGRSCA